MFFILFLKRQHKKVHGCCERVFLNGMTHKRVKLNFNNVKNGLKMLRFSENFAKKPIEKQIFGSYFKNFFKFLGLRKTYS